MEEINSSEYILDVIINSKSFDSIKIIDNLDLKIKKGDFISILGRSGIGKSSLLRLISGIDLKYTGKIRFNGKLIKEPDEGILFLFQSNYLLPWLTVNDNIKFFIKNITSREIDDYLALVGLKGKNQSYPNELSGGEMKRVGLSVALINNCKLLLLDEPFSDLDVGAKNSMYNLLELIIKKNNTTVIMTTHNLDDAVEFSNRIIVFSENPMKVTFDSGMLEEYNKIKIREKALNILINDTKHKAPTGHKIFQKQG